MTALARLAAVVKDRPVLSSERMLRKCSVGKKIGLEFQGACREDELTGYKPPVVK
jgi:hypothetical protein